MVNNVTSSSSATTQTAVPSLSSAALGKEDFLKLLVAQLQNQDPLNPSDPTEFTAQLAQFSSLEQLFSVNSSLAQMAEASNNSQDLERLSSFALIGRQVEMQGPAFNFATAPVNFGYTLDSSATAMSVKILNASDQVVAVLPQASKTAGSHEYSWDGTKINGDKAAPGAYHLVIERTDKGVVTKVASRITGVVDGVDLGASGSVLTTSVGDYTLDQILRVTGS
ncbi:MAG: flagellar hook assembly protein FlgD [Desulfobulbaceae bacterium]|nr:flagellar hook assembly protein FlgD [Desulfobulbaceae bacterium]